MADPTLTAEQRLARSKLAADIRMKRIDQALAREQFEYSKRQNARTGLGALLTPTGGVFVAAAVGLIGTAIGKYADNINAKRQQETAVILKASEVPATLKPEEQAVQRARNLLWFARAHYIDVPPAFEKQLTEDAKLKPGEALSAPVIESGSAGVPLASITCDKSADLVAVFEGFIAKPSKLMDDTLIGYNHELTPEELRSGTIKIDGKSVSFADGLDKAQARQLLEQDMVPLYKAIDELVTVDLTKPQREALASFAWNTGIDNLKRGKVLGLVNAGDFDAVPAELARWNKIGGKELPGLTKRRATEAAVWKCKA